ncbi:MAG: hypothetical protein P8L45_08955 [Longimicrobiales bacterium]|nr:hypothetical protein [Longimicrobiales bacterium]
MEGLRELHSALKPEGNILLFEHVRPGAGWLGSMVDIMNPVARLLGPDMNRRTAELRVFASLGSTTSSSTW